MAKYRDIVDTNFHYSGIEMGIQGSDPEEESAVPVSYCKQTYYNDSPSLRIEGGGNVRACL